MGYNMKHGNNKQSYSDIFNKSNKMREEATEAERDANIESEKVDGGGPPFKEQAPTKISWDTDNPKNKLVKKHDVSKQNININEGKVGTPPSENIVGARGVGQMGTTYADWDAKFGHQWEGMSKKKKKGLYQQWLDSDLVSGQRTNTSGWVNPGYAYDPSKPEGPGNLK